MKTKLVTGIMLTLLFVSMLTLAFNVQPAEASGTIFIRADGSVEPEGTPISSIDNITYTFTDNIYDEIVVERDNIVIDGANHILQGTGAVGSSGISFSRRSNVTIKNMEIRVFSWGIWVGQLSSNNAIYENNITNNEVGINFDMLSSHNTISGNNITNNDIYGVFLQNSYNNTVSGNNITNNNYGVVLHSSFLSPGYETFHNSIFGNTIASNKYGIRIELLTIHPELAVCNNTIYHNNFIDNIEQASIYFPSSTPPAKYTNFWDDGYPSGGNYWSDHVTVDDYSGINQDEPGSDGIVDDPYIIEDYNRDNYPLMKPWRVSPEEAVEDLIGDVESMNLQQGIDNSLDAKLDLVLRSLESLNADQRNDAINKLFAFINEVEAQRGNKITDEQADYLISEAQRIIGLIEG